MSTRKSGSAAASARARVRRRRTARSASAIASTAPRSRPARTPSSPRSRCARIPGSGSPRAARASRPSRGSGSPRGRRRTRARPRRRSRAAARGTAPRRPRPRRRRRRRPPPRGHARRPRPDREPASASAWISPLERTTRPSARREVEGVRDAPRVRGRGAVLDGARVGAEDVSRLHGVEHVAPHADRNEPDDGRRRRPTRTSRRPRASASQTRIGSTSPVESFAPRPNADGRARERRLEAASRRAAGTPRRPETTPRRGRSARSAPRARAARTSRAGTRRSGGAHAEPEPPRRAVDGDEDRELGHVLRDRDEHPVPVATKRNRSCCSASGWNAFMRTVGASGIQ